MGFLGVSGVSKVFQGVLKELQGVSKKFQGVSGGFQGVSDGYYVSGYDILKNTPDLLTYLLTYEAKSRDAVASKNDIMSFLWQCIAMFAIFCVHYI